MRLMLSFPIPEKEKTMTSCRSSTDPMATIDSNRATPQRISLEVRTSTRFLRRWPRPSDSEDLTRTSGSPMARAIGLSNFEHQVFLEEVLSFSVLILEERSTRRFQFPPGSFRESQV